MFDTLFKGVQHTRVWYLFLPTGGATIALIYLCEMWWRLDVHYTFFMTLQTYETTPQLKFQIQIKRC